MGNYKLGDTLSPKGKPLTGCGQIYKVVDIPEERWGLYSYDNSVKELYLIYTDFGNAFTLTGKEISDHYTVTGNEDVYTRMLRWKENVLGVVDKFEGGEL